MHHPHISRHAIHHRNKRVVARSEPLPRDQLPYLTVPQAPSLVQRDVTPSSTCGPDNNSAACEKPTSTSLTTTLPVVLGAVIPIVCAIVVLFFLHRRHVRKLRHEDANDKHKSLDFGMEVVKSGKTGGKGPEMSMTGEKHPHKRGGMSLDIVNSPYLLPPGLHGSRDSLRSLSRSISIDDDKYRPATSLVADNASLRSFPSHPKWGQDDTSSIAGSTRHLPADDMRQGLLKNAQRMSRSSPTDSVVHDGMKTEMEEVHLESDPSRNPSHENLSPDNAHVDVVDLRHSNNYLGSVIHSQEPSLEPHASYDLDEALPGQAMTTRDSSLDAFNFETHEHSSTALGHQPIPIILETPTASESTRSQAPRISLPLSDGASDYGDDLKTNHASPAVNVSSADSQIDENRLSRSANRLTQQFASFDDSFDPHRLTVGIRPLPPEDPADNAEQRANRIRSFYKEYFDDSKGVQEEYYEDFGPEFYADGLKYDPSSGEYLTGPPKPFAQPIGRRAMTPPPRFQGPVRHMTTNSTGGFMPPGPRAFSSVSGRLPGARGPRRPVPPAPLHVLPSPHLLKDDMSILPIDYAPGKSFKDQREGRPETPRGGLRPFSPMLPTHVPLASSFDDLAAIPSPHALRKSGVFTSLDFAPPPRFKNAETSSDAGSIRSNRTGISATHAHNIRAGAYRVSRLPAETVGTKDDVATSLRPKWDMR